ncbi:MAG: hypothetical protein QT04_C0039G0008 [archaeon GW2011_AR11]|nr:MAG: hypothetical protein QT04_C0039G0008 [archaeon GW2011_AR11]
MCMTIPAMDMYSIRFQMGCALKATLQLDFRLSIGMMIRLLDRTDGIIPATHKCEEKSIL